MCVSKSMQEADSCESADPILHAEIELKFSEKGVSANC